LCTISSVLQTTFSPLPPPNAPETPKNNMAERNSGKEEEKFNEQRQGKKEVFWAQMFNEMER